MSCPVPASLARSRVTTYVFYDENDKYDAAESPVKSEEDSKQVILPVTVEEHDDGSVHKARLSRAGVVLESDVKEVSERENPCDYPSGCYLSSSGEAKDPGRADTVRVVVHEVLSEDFGLFTWPSGIVLACLVWSRRREFRGARVIEIGAGTALPGLLAAKLGASVVLTDREDAPWILENMQRAVTTNDLSSDGSGSCAVEGLSWGHISSAATKLATEHPRPKFILGADVFYSSEHFDSVLATVFLFLSSAAQTSLPSVSSSNSILELCETHVHDLASNKGADSGTHSSFVEKARGQQPNDDDVCSSNNSSSESHGSNNRAGVNNNTVIVTAVVGTDGGGTSSRVENNNSFAAGSYSSGAGVAVSRNNSGCCSSSSSSNDQCVFLTAYHERSARRSLRPLLRKWGLAARVLPAGPSRVLPCYLWEGGKYDSVALLEIRLA